MTHGRSKNAYNNLSPLVHKFPIWTYSVIVILFETPKKSFCFTQVQVDDCSMVNERQCTTVQEEECSQVGNVAPHNQTKFLILKSYHYSGGGAGMLYSCQTGKLKLVRAFTKMSHGVTRDTMIWTTKKSMKVFLSDCSAKQTIGTIFLLFFCW